MNWNSALWLTVLSHYTLHHPHIQDYSNCYSHVVTTYTRADHYVALLMNPPLVKQNLSLPNSFCNFLISNYKFWTWASFILFLLLFCCNSQIIIIIIWLSNKKYRLKVNNKSSMRFELVFYLKRLSFFIFKNKSISTFLITFLVDTFLNQIVLFERLKNILLLHGIKMSVM